MTFGSKPRMRTDVEDSPDVSLIFPSLAALFGAETFDDLPLLVQQGASVLAPALRKAKQLNSTELEQSLSQQLERYVQFDECAAAGLVAIALIANMDHVPGDVRSDLNSLVELVFTKLEQKIA